MWYSSRLLAHINLPDVLTGEGLLCRHMFWAQEIDKAVPKEDLGGLHWGLPHNSGGLLVLVRLLVTLQMDDVSPHCESSTPCACMVCLMFHYQSMGCSGKDVDDQFVILLVSSSFTCTMTSKVA